MLGSSLASERSASSKVRRVATATEAIAVHAGFGLVLLDKLGVRTLPLAIAAYKPSSMATQTAVGELFAIMALTVLPLIVFYLIFQKQIRKGMTAGAVK